jgi:hypothetical protein
MNVGIETVVAQFLSWEYLFQIFSIVSLQSGALADVSSTLNFNQIIEKHED